MFRKLNGTPSPRLLPQNRALPRIKSKTLSVDGGRDHGILIDTPAGYASDVIYKYNLRTRTQSVQKYL